MLLLPLLVALVPLLLTLAPPLDLTGVTLKVLHTIGTTTDYYLPHNNHIGILMNLLPPSSDNTPPNSVAEYGIEPDLDLDFLTASQLHFDTATCPERFSTTAVDTGHAQSTEHFQSYSAFHEGSSDHQSQRPMGQPDQQPRAPVNRYANTTLYEGSSDLQPQRPTEQPDHQSRAPLNRCVVFTIRATVFVAVEVAAVALGIFIGQIILCFCDIAKLIGQMTLFLYLTHIRDTLNRVNWGQVLLKVVLTSCWAIMGAYYYSLVAFVWVFGHLVDLGIEVVVAARERIPAFVARIPRERDIYDYIWFTSIRFRTFVDPDYQPPEYEDGRPPYEPGVKPIICDLLLFGLLVSCKIIDGLIYVCHGVWDSIRRPYRSTGNLTGHEQAQHWESLPARTHDLPACRPDPAFRRDFWGTAPSGPIRRYKLRLFT